MRIYHLVIAIVFLGILQIFDCALINKLTKNMKAQQEKWIIQSPGYFNAHANGQDLENYIGAVDARLNNLSKTLGYEYREEETPTHIPAHYEKHDTTDDKIVVDNGGQRFELYNNQAEYDAKYGKEPDCSGTSINNCCEMRGTEIGKNMENMHQVPCNPGFRPAGEWEIHNNQKQ